MSLSIIISIVFGTIIISNIVFICLAVLFERKNPVAALAWIVTLVFIPIIGFILFIIFGGGKRFRLGRIFKLKQEYDEYFRTNLRRHLYWLENQLEGLDNPSAAQNLNVIQLHMNSSKSLYTQDNSIKIYTDAKEKYDDLIADINRAERNIHLLYFIIRNDHVGNEIVKALAKKAREGVEVRLLYDDIGSAFTSFGMFKELIRSGGHVRKFLSSKLGVININANYRNHRKIAVIDGKAGYIGGMNIGDEYMGLHKRIKPWRDTHLRLTGSSVYSLQVRFLMDWAYASNKMLGDIGEHQLNSLFPPVKAEAHVGMQIVSSGPDTNYEEIKIGLIEMLNTAKKSIYIQTPYFIPDAAFLEAIKIASLSGVNVKLMIPGVADKHFVFYGTTSYIRDLLEYGVEVYMYPGFLHSKMLIMDDQIVSTGTTNIDIRSFTLDFEINAFIYDKAFATKCIHIFEEDKKKSARITWDWCHSLGWRKKVFQAICRLLSPVL